MIDSLSALDSQLTVAVNALHSPYFDQFMFLFSNKWIWVPMYATILIILYKRYSWKAALLFLVAIALTITITDQLCASIIRPLFERMRPANPDEPLSQVIHVVNGYRGGPYGFPSCHAANSFALATFLALMRRRWLFGAVVFLWAALNAYSRLYLGVHFAGDLIVGAIIGSIVGFGLFAITNRASHMQWFSGEPLRPTIRIPAPLTSYDLLLIAFAITTAIIAIAACV
ncbi:MAG: phosphatase PAP2 family protein [Muribaculaceae bacterium]